MIDIIALANGDTEAYAGIEALKKSIDNGPPERCEKVVIAGGDGTVTWGVDLVRTSSWFALGVDCYHTDD